MQMRSVLRYDVAFLRTGSVRLSVAALFTITAAFSQMPSISGTVKDQSGASVSNAIVALTDDATNTKKTKMADAAGAYEFTAVPPGGYTVEVQAPGFTAFSKAVTITASPVVLDIRLELGHEATQVAVEGRIDPYNVVPSTPTHSIFGFDHKLEDIPRSISVADAETMLRYGVKTVNDIVSVSSGSFTGSYFGIPGSVFLRGDIGDNFFRGFRRVENRGNFQTPVAATDHIEVVKGPPSPIYGAPRVAAFLTFIPHTTRTDNPQCL